MNCVVFSRKPLKHLGRVEIGGQWSCGARKALEGLVKLAQTAVGQAQVIENSLVGRRQLRGSFQTIDGGAIVTTLVERKAEIVERVCVFWFILDCAFERVFGPFRESFLGESDA